MKQTIQRHPFRKALCLFCALSLSALPLSGAFACKDGSATVSGHTLYPPLSWSRNGKLTGASVEVVSTILKEVGIKTVIAPPAPWKRLIHNAKIGSTDILLGVRKNHEWEHFLTYITPPLTPSVQGVFHLATEDIHYKNWDSLKDKTGGMLRGASFGENFDLFSQKHLRIQKTNTLELNFHKLKKGRIHYFLAPLVPTQLYLHKASLQELITNTEEPLTVIDEYIAISKQSDCGKFAAHFSKRLSELKTQETIDTILEKYFLIWFKDMEEKLQP